MFGRFPFKSSKEKYGCFVFPLVGWLLLLKLLFDVANDTDLVVVPNIIFVKLFVDSRYITDLLNYGNQVGCSTKPPKQWKHFLQGGLASNQAT